MRKISAEAVVSPIKKDLGGFLHRFPTQLIQAIAELLQERAAPCHIAGGTVRDWLMGIDSQDLDMTVARDGLGWAEALAGKLNGTFIPLDRDEDVARVVWREFCIDCTSFREGARTIEEDLCRRDFTINSMAVPFHGLAAALPSSAGGGKIIDPAGGRRDLENRIIRATGTAVFVSDPLRILRAYRFMAVLGFAISPATESQMREHAHLLHFVAEERIRHELDMIMASGSAFAAVSAMHENDILPELLPELYRGVGIEQPSSHHLDVFEHGMATLAQMEAVLGNTKKYFPGAGDALDDYLRGGARRSLLKWAALFHDLGKPQTHAVRDDRGGRITFYNHDKEGARLFAIIADRLKWSRSDKNYVKQLISCHMWPFHLNNAKKKTGLTPRAYVRLLKTAGEEFHGLFLLAMADSMAGSGSGKPPGMEEDVAALYRETAAVYHGTIRPVLAERLLTGTDLITLFGLAPGPLFRNIFDRLENARIAGKVLDRGQAILWVKNYLKSHK